MYTKTANFLCRIGLFALISSSLAIFAAHPAEAQHPAKRRKIGVIVALTGPIAPVGISIRNAAELARAKFDPENSIDVIYEDDQFQSKAAVTAAEKLINHDKVDALVTFSGAPSAAVSEIAERRKLPMVGITALSTIGRSKSFVYSMFLSANEQVDLLSTSAKKSGFARLAVITTVQDAMLEFRSLVNEKNQGRIVRDEEVIPGDINLNSVVTKILSQKPDAVFLFLLPPQVSAASRLFRDQGFRGQFIGGPPLYNPPEIRAAQGTLTGAWLPGPNSKGSEDFLRSYLEKYQEPCISEGLYAYDTLSLLIQASRSENIAEFLNQAESFSGLLGTYPKTSNNVFVVPAELKEIQSDTTLQTKILP